MLEGHAASWIDGSVSPAISPCHQPHPCRRENEQAFVLAAHSPLLSPMHRWSSLNGIVPRECTGTQNELQARTAVMPATEFIYTI